MAGQEYMKLALAKAREGMEHGQTPFGACIVKAGRVVACEHNMVLGTIDATAHAEMQAIRVACRALASIDLTGCTIYSTTEPCPMCFAAIHWAHVDRIVYGAGIVDALGVGFRELTISSATMRELGGCKVEIEGGVMGEAARELFAEFTRRGGQVY